MKNFFVYGVMLSAFLLLGACSGDINEEDLSTVFLEEEEMEVDEYVAFDWAGLANEEKEAMVMKAFEEAGYEDAPLEGAITSLDEAYASLYAPSDDFEAVFAFVLSTLEAPRITDSGDQYGHDTFTENDNNKIVHIVEKDNAVFTVLTRGHVNNLVYSYAKNNTWQERDIPLFLGKDGKDLDEREVGVRTTEYLHSLLQKEGLNPELYDLFEEKLIYDKEHIYLLLRDKRAHATDKNHVLLHFTLSEEGLLENGITHGMPYDPIVIRTNEGKVATILKDEATNQQSIVYLDDKEKRPLTTYEPSNDFDRILRSSTNSVDRAYYFVHRGFMVIGDKEAYHLDVLDGEIEWDSAGQEKTYDFYMRDSAVDFYNENTFAIAYGKDNTFNLYTDLFTPLKTTINLPFDIEAEGFVPEFWMSSDDTSYTVWTRHKFEGKPALRFVKIEKGIGVYQE